MFMEVKNIAEELKERGLVEQEGGGAMKEFLSEKRTVYLGIDPTADSLHVGNMVSVILMRHLSDAGHDIVFIVGGGTGMIGDPRESGERTLLDPEIITANTRAIRAQLEKIFGEKKFEIRNDAEWLSRLGIIGFLRDVGKHFTVNQLVKREIIKKRLEAEDPLSFTEFAYSLLQAYDYLHLYKEHHVDLQVGGSDQWTNIISGVELIRRVTGGVSYALTTPIIVDKKSGKKFGKSEGNAVWIDPKKTSPFAFYQFWINAPDDGVSEYLKIFTLLSLSEIADVVAEHSKDVSKRSGQKKLAYEVTKLIHGEEAAKLAEQVSAVVFGEGSFTRLDAKGVDFLIKGMPGATYTVVEVKSGVGITDALLKANLATSKSEGRRLVEGKGVSINDASVETPEYLLTSEAFASGAALLRVGKKVALLSIGE